MKTGDEFRLDIEALREIASEKTFARGEAYYRNGRVEILSVEPERVLARVAGTEDYRVELAACHGGEIEGKCSCPAFEDRGFCKHMVATALAIGSVDANGGGALARIRDHLEGKGVEALAEMIVAMAERNPALFRRLDMAATTVHADARTIEARLHKAIDRATSTRGFVDYHEAAGWAEDVEAVLDAVADLAAGTRAGLALKLAERAIDRIERAVEGIDDSDGHCGALMEQARGIHLAAARVARPDPVLFARGLFDRELGGQYDLFTGAVALYSDVLGSDGLTEYRRLASDAWAQLPPRSGAARTRDELLIAYDRLRGILDFFAEREGDVDTRIALRAKDLSSPWRYLQLAEFCCAHGRDGEALRRAEEGLWMFEDGRPDERLVFLAVDLLSKAGRNSDAEAQLQRAFDKLPSLELYKRLRRLGGNAARERVVALLESRLVSEKGGLWQNPADLLILVLMHEKMFTAAWAVVRRHGTSTGVKEALARASETSHPREAVDAYAGRIEQLANSGGNTAYTEAAKLISRVAGLQPAAEQAAYVAALKTRFSRKRNLMRLLG